MDAIGGHLAWQIGQYHRYKEKTLILSVCWMCYLHFKNIKPIVNSDPPIGNKKFPEIHLELLSPA